VTIIAKNLVANQFVLVNRKEKHRTVPNIDIVPDLRGLASYSPQNQYKIKNDRFKFSGQYHKYMPSKSKY